MPMANRSSALDPLGTGSKYQKKSDLSSGSFGFVQLAENKSTGELLAIKFLERGEHITKYVETEILNHRSLRHPHVIEFQEAFLTRDHIGIVMEYASGKSLFDYVQKAGRLREVHARWFFQQLIIALDYCHRKGVVNRDIKLENTLLQTVPGIPLPLLKICDFGYSKSVCSSAPKSRVGTLSYMAPEIIKTTGEYDGKKADIWSCGVMLYVMLCGRYPFDCDESRISHGMRVHRILEQINAMRIVFPTDVQVSADLQDLLRKLLVPIPSQRVNIEQVYKHPWFQVNLPPEALNMNNKVMNNPAPVVVQSEQQIREVLRLAQEPSPSRFAWGFGAPGALDDLINECYGDDECS